MGCWQAVQLPLLGLLKAIAADAAVAALANGRMSGALRG